MRIAHVVGTRTAANIRDTEKHVVYLAEAQRARGMDAIVVTTKHGLFVRLCQAAGIPVFVTDDVPRNEGAAPAPSEPGVSAYGMVTTLKDLNPRIIHCHDLPMTQAATAAASLIEVPCMVTLHEGAAGQIVPEIIAAKRRGRKFTVITAAKRECEFLREGGLAGADFHFVPYGTRTRTPTRSALPRQEPGASGGPSLMTVSSLGFVKGIDLAILAMVELRRRHGSDCPVLNVYGAGDPGESVMEKVFGDLGEYYAEMSKVLRLDDVVKFRGIQADALDTCPASDVLIVPSRFETGPLVVLEAMSRGMPVVACDVGQVAEMLPDRRYGRIAPTNSITALADAIESMLADIASGQFDPDLSVARHQSHYSAEKMADGIAAVYQSALARLEKLEPA